MRIFHDRLFFDSKTDEKFRWKKNIDEVPFKLYITQERVPKPAPKMIEVSIFEDKSLYTEKLTKLGRKCLGQLTDSDKSYLKTIGLDETQITAAGEDAILGAAFRSEKYDKTQTVRYNAGRRIEELGFGDPYVPKSVFGDSYPERLLFLVRWIDSP